MVANVLEILILVFYAIRKYWYITNNNKLTSTANMY